jgi:spermidine synthase
MINKIIRNRPIPNRAALSPLLIVLLGGINLILIQWVLVRELTTLLLGTELVILLISISYFMGLSIGYLMADKINRSWLVPLGAITLLLHLGLPVWFRLMVAVLAAYDAYPIAFVIMPLLAVFIVPTFYSIFLPIFADNGEGRLSTLYAAELLGSVCGIAILVALGGLGLQLIFGVYALMLMVILLLLRIRREQTIAAIILGLTWLALFPTLNYWSNAILFQRLQGLPEGTYTLFSGYSPYQKVDLLETPNGSRYLYLDGLEHFGDDDGSWLNVILGRVPVRLIDPARTLVIGAGSMEMERMIAESASHVTTVEIDPVVVDVSLRYLKFYNWMDTLDNRSIVIDDAKHFVANTDEQYDLISTDTPAAFTIQTATLYSEPFFRTCKARLYNGGMMAVNLTSDFAPDDITSTRIAASLLAVFNEVWVVTSESAGWSFAYAGDDLNFNRNRIADALRASGEQNFIIFEPDTVIEIVGNAAPITLDSMDLVLMNSLDWLEDRLR